MSRVYLDYPEDILDAMGKARLLVQDLTYEEFAGDFRTHFAAVRALEIVGEATKRLPDSLREAHPEVPWREMAGMRDRYRPRLRCGGSTDCLADDFAADPGG